jgi:acetyltransferase
MKTCRKPIFPILPSVVTAREEIADFISRGRVFFPDEVVFGRILSAVLHTPPPASPNPFLPAVDKKAIRKVVENAPQGYLDPSAVQALLDAAGIQHTREIVVQEPEAAVKAGIELGYPLVIKVVGPVHKSDVGGVVLNIQEEEILIREFSRLIRIPETTGILIQPMLSGLELFIGAKREAGFGHLILCGMGGIFIEVLKDTAAGLAPLDQDEAVRMIRSLKGYKILQGVRGQQGINDFQFAGIMQKLSALLTAAPEIQELDFNPLLANEDSILVVDSRIKIGK